MFQSGEVTQVSTSRNVGGLSQSVEPNTGVFNSRKGIPSVAPFDDTIVTRAAHSKLSNSNPQSIIEVLQPKEIISKPTTPAADASGETSIYHYASLSNAKSETQLPSEEGSSPKS